MEPEFESLWRRSAVENIYNKSFRRDKICNKNNARGSLSQPPTGKIIPTRALNLFRHLLPGVTKQQPLETFYNLCVACCVHLMLKNKNCVWHFSEFSGVYCFFDSPKCSVNFNHFSKLFAMSQIMSINSFKNRFFFKYFSKAI